MSSFDLTTAVEEFCSHTIYIEEDGRSKLCGLLLMIQKSVASILLELLKLEKFELVSSFLKKVNRDPTECTVFLQSGELDEVCTAFHAVEGHLDLKAVFIQLFLSGTTTNMCSLQGIVLSAISWMASESLQLSDACSQLLSQLSSFDISLAEDVVSRVMTQVQTEAVREDSTVYLRYLCLLAGFMKISSQYFVMCEAKGACAAVVESVSLSLLRVESLCSV